MGSELVDTVMRGWEQAAYDKATLRRLIGDATTSAEQRAVEAERRVKELETALAALIEVVEARAALAQPPESKETA